MDGMLSPWWANDDWLLGLMGLKIKKNKNKMFIIYEEFTRKDLLKSHNSG